MLDYIDIAKLYDNVLVSDKNLYNISDDSIKFGIECMAHVYKGETVGLASERSTIADYTDPAHRCAYLHKYAALHTAMVRDMLTEAIRENFNFFYKILFSGERFKLCSLGGGPGTDVIGVLAALHAAFGYFDASATVVDYMAEWSFSFNSIMNELGTGWYGAFGNNISYYLDWRYLGANLLKTFKPDVLDALSSASLVTMIKFTSAAACMDTRFMIKKIFTAMKPGALLLFIDNDGGGFHNLIQEAVMEFNFSSIFGPYRRESYSNEYFRVKRFGYSSCCKTTVTVHVVQKPYMFNRYSGVLLDNRRVIFGNNMLPKPSLLGSPPTPFLYHGQSPDDNSLVPARSPNNTPRPSLLPSPHTPFSPYMYPNTNLLGSDQNGNRLGYASAYDTNFAQDENVCQVPYFSSPVEEISQSPNFPLDVDLRSRIATPLTSHIVNSPFITRPAIYTPDTQPRRGKRARMQGCFPIKVQNFRHHISKKLNKVKAQARAVFKKKNKNPHPIFNL